MSSIKQITGDILSVDIVKSKLTIMSINTGSTYVIDSLPYIPVKASDVIHGYFKPTVSGGLAFIRMPMILLSATEDNILYQLETMLGCTPKKAEALYQYLSAQCKIPNDNFPATSDMRMNSDMALPAVVFEYLCEWLEYVKICPKNEFKAFQKVFKAYGFTGFAFRDLIDGWTEGITERRLACLGIPTKAITTIREQHCISLSLIYMRLLNNPFYFKNLAISDCESLAKRFGYDNSNTKTTRAVVDIIENQMLDAQSMCTPYKSIAGFSDEIKKNLFDEFKYSHVGEYIMSESFTRIQTTIRKYLSMDDIHTIMGPLSNKTLSTEQKNAVNMILTQRTCMITGAAGSGKTTVIEEACNQMDALDRTYLLVAYTGKAVSRLKRSFPDNPHIMTIHRALRATVNKINHIIIDEATMVDSLLFYRLIDHLNSSGNKTVSFCFVGDPRQLQPISQGDLFNQMMKIVPELIHLTRDYRRIEMGSETALVLNTIAASLSDTPKTIWDATFKWVDLGDDEIINLIKENGWTQNEFKILSPYRKNLDSINCECYMHFVNDNGEDDWEESALVMMKENKYGVKTEGGDEIDVANGDEGVIESVFDDSVLVRFGEHLVEYGLKPSRDFKMTVSMIDYSWAITITKSQGSEWDHVILVLPLRVTSFLTMNLMYTAVTRARKSVTIVSQLKNCYLDGIKQKSRFRLDNLSEINM